MSDRSTRVPRASIGVPILHDPDYLELVGNPGGFTAFGIFTALLVAAKQQQNEGVFSLPRRSIAALIGATEVQLVDAINLIKVVSYSNGHDSWLTTSEDGVAIRSFEKWNCNWGGPREGSGRRRKESSFSSGNQDAILVAPSVSSSSSSSKTQKKNTERASKSRCDEEKPPQPAEEPAAAAGDAPSENDPITPSDRQTHKGDFSAFWEAVPKRHRQAKVACRDEFIRARRRGADPEVLAARVREYYRSHQGRGEYANQPRSWLASGKYDDPPESWKSSELKSAKARNERLIAGEAQR